MHALGYMPLLAMGVYTHGHCFPLTIIGAYKLY